MWEVIVRYGEFTLKSSKVRRRFERQLLANIRSKLKGLKYKLAAERGRIFVGTNSPTKVIERLVRTPGVISVSPAVKTEAKIHSISSSAVEMARRSLSSGESFAIRTRRVGDHPFTSREISEAVGSAVLEEIPGVRVDLSSPDLEIFIEVRGCKAYLFTEVERGIGGMPVGSQGVVIVPFLEELNGPLTCFVMLRRGCLVVPVFLDGISATTRERAISLSRELLKFHPALDLYVVPFSDVREALDGVPAEVSHLLRIRAIMRASGWIARDVGGEAIATGDSLFQEESLRVLPAEDEVTGIPVLRPLAGLDEETIEQLRCMSGISSPSAITGSAPTVDDLDKVRELELEKEIESLIERCVKKAEVIRMEEG